MRLIKVLSTGIFILFFLLTFTGCTAFQEIFNSNRDILSFDLNMSDNTFLEYNITGHITNTSITVTVPYNTDLGSLIPTITISGVTIDPQGGIAQDFTSPVVYNTVAENGSTNQYTVTVVKFSNYMRSPSVFKDGNNIYWLVYAVADNATALADYADSNTWHTAVDNDTYTVYYKMANSIDTLLGAPPNRLEKSFTDRPASFNQRELGAAYLNGFVYIFVSHGLTSRSVYYYKTSDNGNTWDGPTEILIGEGVLHVHAKSGDIGNGERIYINAGAANGTVFEFDGTTVNGTKWVELSADVLAQTVVVEGALYMIARTGTSIRVWYNADFDATTDNSYTIDAALTVSSWDHVFGKIGSIWYTLAAPWIGATDTQYLDMYKHSSYRTMGKTGDKQSGRGIMGLLA
ncbi:MAG: hypothetical protein KAS64_04350 [Spirochaetes bacterium]|nr:hypothetical protein [Spirochaetota bacterium]